jgi:SAM-dependent methyltransferase
LTPQLASNETEGDVMGGRISTTEFRARQLVLQTAAPWAFRAIGKVGRKFQSRARRSAVLERHLRGAGLEIGAAATPATVPPGCRVTYVDKYGLDVLTKDPELRGLAVRAPDVIDEAEHLRTIGSGTQDFVIAFSVAEHVQSPVHMVEAFHRVLKRDGIAVISAPDKRSYGPDKTRPLTTFEHLQRDHREGPEVSFDEHLREVGTVRGMKGADLDAFVAGVKARGGHAHFHVWDGPSFLDFLIRTIAYLGVGLEIIEFAQYGHESLAVLRRTD